METLGGIFSRQKEKEKEQWLTWISKKISNKKEEKMNTLFDFITYVKGVEYIVAILFIAGYIVFWEVLKPKPFKTLTATAKEDIEYIKKIGFRAVIKTIGRVMAAPFIGLAYVAALPFIFVLSLGAAVINGVLSLTGASASFGWRPLEAYFAGRKGKKEKTKAKKYEKK